MSFLNSQDVQIEVSNPQYYPDDSPPPVPNITVANTSTKIGTTPLSEYEVLSVGEYYRHSENDSDPNNYLHMKGTPATRNYGSDHGTESTTGDHLFYSHLNVDAAVPTFNVVNSDSLETYFRELLPAVCGLGNYTNYGGNGIPILNIHQAHNLENSYVVQSVTNNIFPLHPHHFPESNYPTLIWDTTVLHGTSSASHTFDEYEFVLRFKNKFLTSRYGLSDIRVGNNDYQLLFRVEYDPSTVGSVTGYLYVRMYYWFFDYSGDGDRVTYLSGNRSRSFPYPQSKDFRGDYSYVSIRFGEKFSSYVNYGDHFTHHDAFKHNSGSEDGGFPRVSYMPHMVWIGDKKGATDNTTGYNIPTTLEVIGRNNSELSPPVADLMETNIHPDVFNSYYPLYSSVSENNLPMMFPKYSGNMWEYANKVATNLPYESKVF